MILKNDSVSILPHLRSSSSSFVAGSAGSSSARDAIVLDLGVTGSLELGSVTAPPPPQAHLCFFPLSAFPSPLCLSSSFPGGDDWASGCATRHASPGPLPATSTHQVCPPLLFPSAVRNGAPQTLTKLFVFGSDSVTVYYLLT